MFPLENSWHKEFLHLLCWLFKRAMERTPVWDLSGCSAQFGSGLFYLLARLPGASDRISQGFLGAFDKNLYEMSIVISTLVDDHDEGNNRENTWHVIKGLKPLWHCYHFSYS